MLYDFTPFDIEIIKEPPISNFAGFFCFMFANKEQIIHVVIYFEKVNLIYFCKFPTNHL